MKLKAISPSLLSLPSHIDKIRLSLFLINSMLIIDSSFNNSAYNLSFLDKKGLRDSFKVVLVRLQEIESISEEHNELLKLIHYMATIMDGLKEEADEKLLKDSHRAITNGDGFKRAKGHC